MIGPSTVFHKHNIIYFCPLILPWEFPEAINVGICVDMILVLFV